MATARECIKKIILENIKGRKLVVIERFEKLETFLAEQGIVPEFHISFDKGKIDNNQFYDITTIVNKKEEFYIMIPYEIDDILKNLIHAYGYELIKDYCYLQIMHKKVSDVEFYHDGFNNYCNSIPSNLHITFAGTNAKIVVEKNVKFNGVVEIEIYDDAEIIFRENSFIEGKFRLASYSKVLIGKNCGGRFQAISAGENTNVKIGDYTTFTSSGVIIAASGNIEIGEDCMIAANNTFWSGDGHAIYDINTGEHINAVKERNKIVLKDHVWVGTKSIILSKTVIESGSIVGAGSVVKGIFPNNCVVAGNPAKKKKNDIFWCRDPYGNIKETEKLYYNKTIE